MSMYLLLLLWGAGRGEGRRTAEVQERDVKYWDCMA